VRRPVRRLRRHLVLAFTAFTVLVAAVFGLYAVVFMYAVEDSVFEAQLAREAAVQLATHAAGGDWRAPADTGIVLYRDPARFPADLKPGFAQEPWRSEFSGREGRHYHVRQLQPPAPAAPAWLVAEVSRQLVVRPIRDRVVMVLACTALVMVLLAIWLGVWLARRGTRPPYRLGAPGGCTGWKPCRCSRRAATRWRRSSPMTRSACWRARWIGCRSACPHSWPANTPLPAMPAMNCARRWR